MAVNYTNQAPLTYRADLQCVPTIFAFKTHLFLNVKTSMNITRYGITLSRLTHQDIELVRQWRNHAEVNRHFEHRTHITATQQAAWFQNIDNAQNFFYLVHYQGRKIGVISTFDVDWSVSTAQAGIFMWDTAILETHIPVFAVLAMLDINFLILNIQKMFIKVKQSNKKAIAYNKGLGYQLLPDQAHKEFQHYALTPKRYLKKTAQLRRVAQKLSNDQTIIHIRPNTPNKIIKKINSTPTNIKQQLMLSIEVSKQHQA